MHTVRFRSANMLQAVLVFNVFMTSGRYSSLQNCGAVSICASRFESSVSVLTWKVRYIFWYHKVVDPCI